MEPFFHLAYSPWVQKLGGALLHSLWQGALVAALMALVLRLLRQHKRTDPFGRKVLSKNFFGTNNGTSSDVSAPASTPSEK